MDTERRGAPACGALFQFVLPAALCESPDFDNLVVSIAPCAKKIRFVGKSDEKQRCKKTNIAKSCVEPQTFPLSQVSNIHLFVSFLSDSSPSE